VQDKKSRPSKRSTEIILPSRIGIVFSDVRREYFPTEAQFITEKDAEEDAKTIGDYLESLGFSVILHPGNSNLPAWLRKNKPELVINLVDNQLWFIFSQPGRKI
jgi:hypothetical protein